MLLESTLDSMHYMLMAPNRTAPSPVPVRTIELVTSFRLGKNLWHYCMGGRKSRPALSPKQTLWKKRKAKSLECYIRIDLLGSR